MASALAVLADDNVVHGPLEVLLTMTEEAGMDGAFGLQSGWLQADILINTDSEEEGEIYMGCAGGIDFTSNLPLTREAVPAGFACFKLTLKGLKGGHSGGEIHLGLGNANKLLARFLAGHAEELDLRLIDFNGGTLRNAIPRSVRYPRRCRRQRRRAENISECLPGYSEKRTGGKREKPDAATQ